jgi:uncharacterized protein (TIGR00297 family)
MTNIPSRRTKAIPPARDRLQSQLLVWIVTTLLCLACAQLIYWTLLEGRPWELYVFKSLAVSIAFALTAGTLRAATPPAALIGGMICLILTFYTGTFVRSVAFSGLAPLFTLFLITFFATRAGRKRKIEYGLAESRRGRRASQVIANLGVAAIVCNMPGSDAITWLARNPGISDLNSLWVLRIVMLAALAEATADTVSSEIGQAFGGTPFMLTTLRRVPPGTDGAISLKGTLAGIAAAALIAATGAPALGMSPAECAIAFAAGAAGLFFDSILGATVERKGWLGNDLVNFTSTAFAAAVALLAIRLGQPYLAH